MEGQAPGGPGNVSPEGKASVLLTSYQQQGFFCSGSGLENPEVYGYESYLETLCYHLSGCEPIVHEGRTFVQCILCGFTTGIRCLEVLLRASRSYWKPQLKINKDILGLSSPYILFSRETTSINYLIVIFQSC